MDGVLGQSACPGVCDLGSVVDGLLQLFGGIVEVDVEGVDCLLLSVMGLGFGDDCNEIHRSLLHGAQLQVPVVVALRQGAHLYKILQGDGKGHPTDFSLAVQTALPSSSISTLSILASMRVIFVFNSL